MLIPARRPILLALAFLGATLGVGACASDKGPSQSQSADPGPSVADTYQDARDPENAKAARAQLLSMTGLKPPSALTKRLSSARLYVDRSRSMAGYQREAGGPLQELVATLGSALSQQKLAGLAGIGFGARVESPRDIAAPAETLDWEANADAACLVNPLSAERTSSAKSPALFILMTDDVVPPNGGRCVARCPDGDEIGCVAQGLYEYLQGGNGLWVFGVRVPYHGDYYPAARQGPLAVASAQRPIYLWIGGPNARVGRATAERLVKWAVERQPRVDHIAIEIWPGHWNDDPPSPGAARSTFNPWSAQSAASAIAAWSTEDDATVADISKTLGFEPLWTQMLRRLESIRRTLG
jgi:hypothetical protein